MKIMSSESALQKIRFLLFETKRYELAINEIQLELSQSPDNHFLYAYFALALSALDKQDEALIQAQKAIEMAPDDDYVYFVLASVYLEKKDLKKAQEIILQAIQINPFWEIHFHVLASIYLAQNQIDKSLEASEYALSLNPESFQALNYKAIALIRKGDYKGAEYALALALKENPEGEFSLISFGHLLLKQNKAQKAIEKFEQALRINPNSESAREGLLEAFKHKNWLYGSLSFLLSQMSNFFKYLANKKFLNIILGLFIGLMIISILIPKLLPSVVLMGLFTLSRLFLLLLIIIALLGKLMEFYFLFREKYRLALSEEQIKNNKNLLGASLLFISILFTCFIARSEKMAGLLIINYIVLFITYNFSLKQSINKYFKLFFQILTGTSGLAILASIFISFYYKNIQLSININSIIFMILGSVLFMAWLILLIQKFKFKRNEKNS